MEVNNISFGEIGRGLLILLIQCQLGPKLLYGTTTIETSPYKPMGLI